MMSLHGRIDSRGQRGFTLVELLVVVAVVGVLVGLVLSGAARVRHGSKVAASLQNLRHLAQFASSYAEDARGAFPASQHSAVARGQLPWEYIYFGEVEGTRDTPAPTDPRLHAFIDSYCRSPLDPRQGDPLLRRFPSYGQNVYFELGPEETGGPTWPRLARIPLPARTVLYGELEDASVADHIMAHFWTAYGAPPEVAVDRNRPGCGCAFVDGHVENLLFEQTFTPQAGVNLWNPQTAR
ncbi:MAG: prepilin-type N-terminal cleavage/methylation domain-containing protein [Phycisphaerales bacterium]|nr:prepilin-type N-terminal cleavage/methylation domain-containing protein [Phycisphaerales bacterium]